jgi:hypothetical protein
MAIYGGGVTKSMTLIKHDKQDKLRQLALKGWEHRKWYSHTRNAAIKRFDKDADEWLTFFALTSPNATVAANASLATKALEQYKSQQPFVGYMKTVTNALNHWKEHGEIDPSAGFKVKNFYCNLHQQLECITIDRWIARAWGLKSNPSSIQTYSTIALHIRRLADELQCEPAECQAAIWGAQLIESGKPVTDVHSLIKWTGTQPRLFNIQEGGLIA